MVSERRAILSTPQSAVTPDSMEMMRVVRDAHDAPSAGRIESVSSPPNARATTPSPSTDELLVLSLLITGLTDEVASSRIGWTRRTFRRRLKGAMDKLGAVSRLQAGYMYALSSWPELAERKALEDPRFPSQE